MRCLSAIVCALVMCAAPFSAEAQQNAITPAGQALAHALDSMGVEQNWPAGLHINWETGVPDGKPESGNGKHTHCSAFVASAAKHLGVYILRPPEHGQELLANAQNEWLPQQGAAAGWRPLKGAADAQDAANRGQLVVASYHNHKDDKPGHIAIVRPSTKDIHALASEGPDIIQAGTINRSKVSVKEGFAGHPAAWNHNEIEYYAHDVKQ